MLFDDALVMTLYSVPFVIAMMAPGRKSITVAALGVAAVVIYVTTANPENFSAAMGLGFIALCTLGLAVGLVTRSITLLIAPMATRPMAFTSIMALGYALPLILMAGPKDVGHWLTRSTLATCAQATYRVRVGDTVLRLPPAPAFSISVPNGTSRYDDRNFPLQFDSGFRDICREGLNENKVIGPAVLDIQPVNVQIGYTVDGLKPWCEMDDASATICRSGSDGRPKWWVERVQLYGEGQTPEPRPGYAVQKRLAEHPQTLTATGGSTPAGSFEIYDSGLRVARGPEWRGSDGQPFRMICEDVAKGQTLLCAAEDKLQHGITARVTFRTRTADVEADAGVIRDFLSAFLEKYSF